MIKKQIIFLAFTLMVSVFHYRSWAQQNLNVSGQSVKINGLHFDYSIGEMTLISTQSNSKITVTQGILQPTIPVTKMPNQQGSSATLSETNIKVYPNPTENILFIESFENEDAELSFQLYDLSGRVIYTEKMNRNAGNNKHSISLRTNAAGTYFLILHKKSVNNQEENFSFKIQKEN